MVGEAGDLSASRDPPQAPSVSRPGLFLFELWPELASAAAEGVASLQGGETRQAVKPPSLSARRERVSARPAEGCFHSAGRDLP
jgi:hypothetical protein